MPILRDLLQTARRARESFHRLLTEPQSELGRWQKSLRFLADLTRHCAGELRHDKAGQMAAALTYHTLFSLLPVTALALVAMSAFVGPEERSRLKETAVDGVVQVLRGDAVPADSLATGPLDAGELDEFDKVRLRLDEWFQAVLTDLEDINFSSIGLVGVILFIWSATGLLATIEGSFNQILGGASGRPWYLRLPLYYTVITLGPILVLAGLLAQQWFLDRLVSGAWTNWLAGPAVVMAPVLTTWLVLFLMYVLLPTSPVVKKAAVSGSLVAAILFVAARELFRVYVSRTVATTLYGAMALVPLTLLLVWLSWVLVLFGLELSYTLQNMRGRRFKRERYKRLEGRLFDPSVAVPLAARVVSDFRAGRVCSREDLAGAFRLPPVVVTELMDRLARAEIVRPVERDESPRSRAGYVPGRDPATIPVSEVLDAVGGPGDLAPGTKRSGPAWHWVAETRHDVMREARAATLADLVADEPVGDPA